jgi:biofilm PGA synthesis N-glycosyltransferase PgaC
MNFEYFFGILVIALGIINVFRVASYFILSDWYNFLLRKKSTSGKITLGKYQPTVDILVTAYNEEKVVQRCLESIYESDYPYINVIVINDGSQDNTAQIVRDFKKKKKLKNLTLINKSNGGKATALNFALQGYVRHSLVMTVDADSIIAPKAISRVVWYFRDPRIVAVAANIKIIPNYTALGVIQYIEYLMGYHIKKAYSVLNNEYIIGGIGATYRRRTMEQVGYYDTNTITEDIDLTLKILRLGNKKQKIVYAPNVICYTESVMSFKSLFKQRFRWKYGRFQTLWKNRRLFFITKKTHSKLFSWLQLPFVLYSEFTFLIDPLLIGYIIYISAKYGDIGSLQGVFTFFWFYTVIAIVSDHYTNWRYKLQLIFFAPFAYLFFFAVSFVEYIALWKCLINFKGIFDVEKNGDCRWEHVERLGTTT